MTDPIPSVEQAVQAEAARVDAEAKSIAARLEADAAAARGTVNADVAKAKAEVAAVKTGWHAFQSSPAFVPALVAIALDVALAVYVVHRL